TGAAWPLDRMKRSRSGQCGFLGSCRKKPPKYSAVTTSTADIELLGCPEPASVVIFTMSPRSDLARASRASRLFVTDASSLGVRARWAAHIRSAVRRVDTRLVERANLPFPGIPPQIEFHN